MRGLLLDDDPRGLDRARDCARVLKDKRMLEAYCRPGVEWSWVKNFDEFVAWVRANGIPDILAFDHDLDEEAYALYVKNGGYVDREIDYSEYKEKTGFHCAQWLVEHCMDTGSQLTAEFHAHSMNPGGRENISRLLTRYRRFQLSGR